jgi:phosphoglycerate dehydrogenase-like enzyme
LRYESIVEAASRADWLVIACPLSGRTQGLVDARVLDAMPQGAHVVNVGRGEVVVEADLIGALSSGHLAGAFLDVFEREPLPPDSPLWSMPNVIATPHSAGHSAGNEARVAQMFLAALRQRLG